jgi:hypothetical protein
MPVLLDSAPPHRVSFKTVLSVERISHPRGLAERSRSGLSQESRCPPIAEEAAQAQTRNELHTARHDEVRHNEASHRVSTGAHKEFPLQSPLQSPFVPASMPARGWEP